MTTGCGDAVDVQECSDLCIATFVPANDKVSLLSFLSSTNVGITDVEEDSTTNPSSSSDKPSRLAPDRPYFFFFVLLLLLLLSMLVSRSQDAR